MMRYVCHIIVMLMLFPSVFIIGQEQNKNRIETDTINIRRNIQILGIPILLYTPETSFGFGAGSQIFLNNQANIYNSRLSNILVTAIYTAKKQLIVEARPQVYFYAGDLFMDGLFRYKVFPNSFWGIGNYAPDSALEQYNMKSFELTAAFLKRLPPTLNFGIEYRYENYNILEVEEGGLMAEDDIPGSEGATVSGLSFLFNLDDRDNVISARRGNLIQVKAGFSSRVFGATYSFNKYTLDVRRYINLYRENTLAMQAYLEGTFGEVPFQSLAWLGGGEKMRGYFKGRYMDKSMYAFQAEYRIRFHPRWTAAAFGSMGEVANFPLDFFVNPKFSFGGGIRFKILRNNPTIIRFDVGFDQKGKAGMYFGVNEAF